jgi:hypothetical protein
LNAKIKAQSALKSIEAELAQTDWWNETWLDDVLDKIELNFNQACERWRNLYRSAHSHMLIQMDIIKDYSRPSKDKKAGSTIIRRSKKSAGFAYRSGKCHSIDFYSYRYFASEGFLTGLQLSTFASLSVIPARRAKKQNDDSSLDRGFWQFLNSDRIPLFIMKDRVI